MAHILRTAPLLDCLETSSIGIDDEEPRENRISERDFDVARNLGTFPEQSLRYFAPINCKLQYHCVVGRHSASIISVKLEMLHLQQTRPGEFQNELREGGARHDNNGLLGITFWTCGSLILILGIS